MHNLIRVMRSRQVQRRFKDLVGMMNFPFGKVPPEILEAVVFRNLGAKDKDVILGPTRGEDAAILKVGDRLIATSCDPVSGAVDRAGLLAVNVSANDVAAEIRSALIKSFVARQD